MAMAFRLVLTRGDCKSLTLGLPTKLFQISKVKTAFLPLWTTWQASLGHQRKLSRPASQPLPLWRMRLQALSRNYPILSLMSQKAKLKRREMRKELQDQNRYRCSIQFWDVLWISRSN